MSPPEKLKIKPGDIKLPIIKELKIVRNIVISKAQTNPKLTKAIKVIMLACPKRNTGIGWVIKDSVICRTHAIDTRPAILYIFCSALSFTISN